MLNKIPDMIPGFQLPLRRATLSREAYWRAMPISLCCCLLLPDVIEKATIFS
jgi:hypothetical protein